MEGKSPGHRCRCSHLLVFVLRELGPHACPAGRQQPTVSARLPLQVLWGGSWHVLSLPVLSGVQATAVTAGVTEWLCAAPHSALPTAVPLPSDPWWLFLPRAGATSVVLNLVKRSHRMAWKVPSIVLGFLGVWFSSPAVHIQKFNLTSLSGMSRLWCSGSSDSV